MNQESKPPCSLQCGNEPDWDCETCHFRNRKKPYFGNRRTEWRAKMLKMPNGADIYIGSWSNSDCSEAAHNAWRLMRACGDIIWIQVRRVQCQ
jgi:hypothetical protein